MCAHNKGYILNQNDAKVVLLGLFIKVVLLEHIQTIGYCFYKSVDAQCDQILCQQPCTRLQQLYAYVDSQWWLNLFLIQSIEFKYADWYPVVLLNWGYKVCHVYVAHYRIMFHQPCALFVICVIWPQAITHDGVFISWMNNMLKNYQIRMV